MIALNGWPRPPHATQSIRRLRKLRNFLHSPKGCLLAALLAQAALATIGTGAAGKCAVVMGAVVGSTGTEIVLVWYSRRALRLPSSSLLTGLVIGLLLGPQEAWYVAGLAGVLGIGAKHLLRVRRTHIFNPAALGLFAAYLLFTTVQSWWGALPELPGGALVVLISGGWVANRANKLPAAIAFLATYFGMFTVAAFVAAPAPLGEVYRTPLMNVALFSALFMVTDPSTSPVAFRDQLWFGCCVALASCLAYALTRGVYFPLAGLLCGNAAYAGWRVMRQHRQAVGEARRPVRLVAARSEPGAAS
jgi:Na+-translocating ferredoxin:NAD+ oxidoreductase RnfD subunit